LTGVPYLNYSLNPDWEDINSRGYRGDLVTLPKPDGIFRIVAIGGSTTYGHGLPTDQTWPYQLQQILRDQYGLAKVEVVNLGAPGYYSLDSVVNLATRGLAHEPDLVLAYDGVNDAVIRMYQDPACYNGDTPLFAIYAALCHGDGSRHLAVHCARTATQRIVSVGCLPDGLAGRSHCIHGGAQTYGVMPAGTGEYFPG